MIRKQVLMADRVRRPPRSGWSWIDRRFVREFAPRLSRDAILLYFFLAAVSDRDGLSLLQRGHDRGPSADERSGCASRSRCGPTPPRSGSSIKAGKSGGSHAATRGAG